ncbi:kinase [Streptomyces sp. NRRL B-1140]|nr:kinase [Streptomyces sp. NRRL B-1140]
MGPLPRAPTAADHQWRRRVTESVPGTVGTEDTRLIVIRGNSASGKSSVAAGLREKFGRNLAIVAQDNLRRIVLRERDRPGGANIGLIDLTARYALNNGFHVVVEGILYADRYGTMLQDLVRAHRGVSRCYYLHVPYTETLLRHATKPDAEYLKHVTADHLRDWYREKDLLPDGLESVIDAASTLDDTIQQILRESGLDQVLPIDR